MDSQMPPGMFRRTHSGLDKSLMGLEMRGGGSTSVENPYDDAWIHTWQTDAEGREQGYADRIQGLERMDEHLNEFNRHRADETVRLFGLVEDLDTRITDQRGAIDLGLAGMDTATQTMQELGSSFDSRLSAQQNQLSEQLRLAQQGWANTAAAQQAGWDSERAAWNQQSADWQNQYAQQQRAIETQLATEQEEQAAAIESLRSTYGIQREEDRTAWEEQSAEDREWMSRQLERIEQDGGGLDPALIEEWNQRLGQSQEQSRIDDAIVRRDLEAQMADFGNEYTRDWHERSQAFEDQYASLSSGLDEAGRQRGDLSQQLMEQAAQFERLQLDQEAAYNTRAQELAAQDRVFGTQIDDLRRQLGIETDLRGSAQQDFQEYQRIVEQQRRAESLGMEQRFGGIETGIAEDIGDLRTDLTGQLGEVGMVGQLARAALEASGEQARSELQTGIFGKIEDVQSDFAGQVGELEMGIGDFERRQFERQSELAQDVTGQLGDFRADIAEYKDTLAGQNEAQEAYYDANKRFREMQIQDAERARTTQAYGSPGTTMNQQVKGVRRAGSSKPGGLVRSKSPRNVFNRSGLRISSLNI